MGLFHVATLKPSKSEIIASWVPTQPWGPSADTPLAPIGAFRFDDPKGRVGMETHLVMAGDTLLQVPLTYRDEPLAGAEDALIVEMQHSALGTRWVYDGLHDPLLVTMLAAVALTGQGEALGMVEHNDRWHIAPSNVRIRGGGWTGQRAPVDGFELEEETETGTIFRSDQFELTVCRRPVEGSPPPIGLTATWEEQPNPVVLAEVRPASEPNSTP